jgi:hypothetical protein
MTTTIFRGRVESNATRTYSYVPFEVPAGTQRIEISYQYSDKVGSEPWLTHGNTIDIGLCDSRGITFGAMGFRGWTGSARDSLTLTPTESTPGYVVGDIIPGTWTILLGFYKIAAQGCDYEVTITVSEDGTGSSEGVQLPLLELDNQVSHAKERPDHWYRGELHCHTDHSDGDSSVEAVVAEAMRLGLDFLAIMDHNNVSHHQSMLRLQQVEKPPITLIPGCEMTTYFGHWNVWGLSDWVEFRVESPDHLRTAMLEAKRRGGLVSCNHPRTYGPPWDYPEVTDYHCLEAWNGPWPLNNWEALGYYESELRKGRQIVMVGGSDMHRLRSSQQQVARLAVPTNWIYCPHAPTASALLNAIRAGHNSVSDSPDGPRVSLHVNGVMMGGKTQKSAQTKIQVEAWNSAELELIIRGASGERLTKTISDQHFTGEFELDCSDELFLYVQLRIPTKNEDQPLIRAMSNPVYFR